MWADASSELNESDLNTLYLNKAISSIQDNPKETLFGTIQKRQQLPGEYYLSADAESIVIDDQRIDWKFVIGNLQYTLERFFF